MNDWTSGYVADIGYIYGYYPELNPLRSQLALVSAGVAYPEIKNACELGFGQGVSINVHAAASKVQWHGTDFNPAHASFAQHLADASKNAAKLYDEAFEDFCARRELPDFDFIALHGIWSWISDDNRRLIVEFVRRKLKVGGILYISYNTLPGWAAFTPLRELLAQHAAINGSIGQGAVARIDGAIQFAEKFIATNPIFSRALPQVAKKLKQIKDENRNYVAHEYFNKDFYPFSFARVAEALTTAKVSFAASAHYQDHVNGINVTTEQQAILDEIADPDFKQTVRDLCTNQNFRKDYFVRGPRRLNNAQKIEALRGLRVMLVNPRASVTYKVKGALGEVEMNEDSYKRLLDVLGDHRARTFAEIEQTLKGQAITLPELHQAVVTLITKGDVAPVQNDDQTSACKPGSDRLNAFLIRSALTSNEVRYLASPATCGAVAVDRMQRLFLLFIGHGRKLPDEWADAALNVLVGEGRRLVKEGKTLESREENLAELRSMAREFAENRLPLLRALGIA